MGIKVLDVDETTTREHAFAAAKDAESQHRVYWVTHSPANQKLATDLRSLAQTAYFRSRTYVTARDKFISVKVEKPQKADSLQNVKEMEALYNFIKANKLPDPVATRNSLLFRIPK